MIGSLFNLIREAVILLLHNFITWFSFNNEIESMVDTLTHKLDEPEQKIGTRLFSHPGGFIKDLGKRRMNIAQAYIKITRIIPPKMRMNG